MQSASGGEPGVERLRVVSFNVNGIRAVLKRKFNTVASLLREVEADILCIQETKLRRSEIERSLAVVDGWDSFFAFSNSNRGYSGVATFVKSVRALPHAAEVGFTQACTRSCDGSSGPYQPHPCLSETFTCEELQELDGEGRVVVTDHGAFVLFNVYGPALTSEEVMEQRMAFKLRFYQALQLRWEALVRGGRAVVVVGDLNICPAPLDSCSPETNFYRSSRPDRLWLRSLLGGGAEQKLPIRDVPPKKRGAQLPASEPWPSAGAPPAAQPGMSQELPRQGEGEGLGTAPSPPASTSRRAVLEGHAGARFVDVFRAFHPRRPGAFTCWNTATSARRNNYGARIDLVLAAGCRVGGGGEGDLTAACSRDGSGRGEQGGGMKDVVEVGPGGAQPLPIDVQQGGAGRGGCCGGNPKSDSGNQEQGTQVAYDAASPCRTAGLPPFSWWVSGCDIMADMEGSDHAPVWMEVSHTGRFPCAAAPPPCASRHAFSGRQTKLRDWLAVLGGGAQQDSDRTSTQIPAAVQGRGEAGSGGSQDSMPQCAHHGSTSGTHGGMPALSGRSSSQQGGEKKGAAPGKRQASLKGFLLPSTSSSAALACPLSSPAEPGAGGVPGSVPRTAQPSRAAGVGQGQGPPPAPDAALLCPPACLRAEPAGGSSEALLDAQPPHQPQGVVGGAPAAQAKHVCTTGGGGGVGKGEHPDTAVCDMGLGGGSVHGWRGGGQPSSAAYQDAVGAWRQIQQRMAAPRCGHGEEAALKRVNKSGPNHGRYFYVCARPDGPKPHGQCNFFQWVKKRPGDFAAGGAGSGAQRRR